MQFFHSNRAHFKPAPFFAWIKFITCPIQSLIFCVNLALFGSKLTEPFNHKQTNTHTYIQHLANYSKIFRWRIPKWQPIRWCWLLIAIWAHAKTVILQPSDGASGRQDSNRIWAMTLTNSMRIASPESPCPLDGKVNSNMDGNDDENHQENQNHVWKTS